MESGVTDARLAIDNRRWAEYLLKQEYQPAPALFKRIKEAENEKINRKRGRITTLITRVISYRMAR